MPLPIIVAIVTSLTITAASSRAQAPGNYDLHEVPASASLHKVTAAPAEYKGRKGLKIEFTEAANNGPPGVDLLFDKPTCSSPGISRTARWRLMFWAA